MTPTATKPRTVSVSVPPRRPLHRTAPIRCDPLFPPHSTTEIREETSDRPSPLFPALRSDRGPPPPSTGFRLQFKNTEHAANLFALKELGNIYAPHEPHHALDRIALEGCHPSQLSPGLRHFRVLLRINLAQAGDNIVSSSKLYGGTYTQFNDILPTLGITAKFVDAEDPENFKAIDDKTRYPVLRDRV